VCPQSHQGGCAARWGAPQTARLHPPGPVGRGEGAAEVRECGYVDKDSGNCTTTARTHPLGPVGHGMAQVGDGFPNQLALCSPSCDQDENVAKSSARCSQQQHQGPCTALQHRGLRVGAWGPCPRVTHDQCYKMCTCDQNHTLSHSVTHSQTSLRRVTLR
jgi:hypothetical protein